jgi:hypothetical protein
MPIEYKEGPAETAPIVYSVMVPSGKHAILPIAIVLIIACSITAPILSLRSIKQPVHAGDKLTANQVAHASGFQGQGEDKWDVR